MTVIGVLGIVFPLFSFLIAGSSHVLILPRKMSARTFPLKRILFGPPSSRYGIDVAERAQGIWTQPLQAAAWSGVSGASLAPKSTVRLVICAMPPPEPIGPYVTLMPYAASTFGIHADTSGATNELPAPVRDPAEAPAPAPVVTTSAAPIAVRRASVLRVKIAPLVWFMSCQRARAPSSCGKNGGFNPVTM